VNEDDYYMWVTSSPDDLYPLSTKYVRSDSLMGIFKVGKKCNFKHSQKQKMISGKYPNEDIEIPTTGCYLHILM